MKPSPVRLSCIFIFLLQFAFAQDNFVRNGGFEKDGNKDGVADYWFVHPSSQQAVEGGEYTWVTTEPAPEGKAFMRLVKTGGKSAYFVSSEVPKEVNPMLMAAKGKTLQFTGKIRATGLEAGASATLLIFSEKPGSQAAHLAAAIPTAPLVTGNSGWTDVAVMVRLDDVIPPGEELHRIEVNLRNNSNTGHADFDAVSLRLDAK